MNRDEVIKRFCELATVVGAHHDHEHAHDCFCSDRPGLFGEFQFNPAIIGFIEDAVKQAMDEGKKIPHWSED
jgi:hypothetical protein